MQRLSWCKNFYKVFHLLRIFFMHLIAMNFIPSPRLNSKIDVWLPLCYVLLQLYVFNVYIYDTFFQNGCSKSRILTAILELVFVWQISWKLIILTFTWQFVLCIKLFLWKNFEIFMVQFPLYNGSQEMWQESMWMVKCCKSNVVNGGWITKNG
jgi:hypothetical protein